MENRHGRGWEPVTDPQVVDAVGQVLDRYRTRPGETFLTPDRAGGGLWARFVGDAALWTGPTTKVDDTPTAVTEPRQLDPSSRWWFGYALDEDGRWRPRHWAVGADGVLRDGSDCRASRYVGFELSAVEVADAGLDVENNLVKVRVFFDADEGFDSEAMWAQGMGDRRAIVNNVPYGETRFTYGSVVRHGGGVVYAVESHMYEYSAVVETDPGAPPEKLFDALTELGAVCEWAVPGVLVLAGNSTILAGLDATISSFPETEIANLAPLAPTPTYFW